jgi:hypothetical protein
MKAVLYSAFRLADFVIQNLFKKIHSTVRVTNSVGSSRLRI